MTTDYGSPNNGPYYPQQPQPVQPQGPVQYPAYQPAPAPAQPMPPYQPAPAQAAMPPYQPAPAPAQAAPAQPMPAYQPAPAPTQPMPAQPMPAYQPTQPMPPYQPGYGGYGGYGQGMPPQQPPQEPKSNSKPIIIAVLVLVLVVIAALVIWLIVRNNNPTPPPPVTTSMTVPATTATEPGDTTEPIDTATIPDDGFPTDFGSVVDSPFCNAYYDFFIAINDWDSYQSAVDSNDYSTADGYMVNFLAAAKAMQAAGPPSDMKDAVNTIVDYFTRAHAALQKGNMSGITQTDYANYSLALLTVSFSGLSECFTD